MRKIQGKFICSIMGIIYGMVWIFTEEEFSRTASLVFVASSIVIWALSDNRPK